MEAVTSFAAERRKRQEAKPLTVARIEALKPRSHQYWTADAACPGLYVRVASNGGKSYYVRSRVGPGRQAKQRNVRLGAVGQLTLAEARKRALSALAEFRAGIDPVAEKRRTAATVRSLIVGYGNDLERRGVVNAKAARSSLDRNLRPLMDTSVQEVTRPDLVRLIEDCERQSGPAAAVAFRAHSAAMLNWAVNTGVLASSVLAGYKAPRKTRAQRLRATAQLAIAGDEPVAKFWRATEVAPDPVFRDFLRFCLLTGQRRTETSLMRWRDIDDGWWIIPAEVRKNGQRHSVPLGPVSRQLLAAQPLRADLVWPGRSDVPMLGWSQRLHPVKAAMGEPRLALHALRRGYRTGLRELGADSDLAEAMIGHTRRGLNARYDKSEMKAARQELQERWELWLGEAVGWT